jgi:anhydro-N-acetylmuramic acid kinase
MPQGNESLFIGLNSGTSRDGVDAALVSFENNRPDLLHAICSPYPAAIAKDLADLLATGERPPPGKAAGLDEQLGRFFARCANELAQQAGVEKRDIRAIGSHGQTVWHEPNGERPVSVQLGNPSLIARSTGIITVADFRTADLRAGGQGAPLAPLLHQQLFQSSEESRAVLNIGGISNVTLLASNSSIAGFDCGPGNCLMDAWIRKSSDKDFDAYGEWAAGGEVNDELLGRLLDDPYFSLPAPKSTGLEYFNLAWLEVLSAGMAIDDQDMQCTLAELTAITVTASLPADLSLARLLVCGGGVHNYHLLARLSSHLSGVTVESTQHHGVDPDWLEATLFAWLAKERLDERLQDIGPITGARKPILLGKIYGKVN